MTKRKQPIYEEMRSLAPYFLTIGGIYMAVMIVLFFALGFDYSLPLGGLYGIVISALNFLVLGKTAQKALRKPEKSANTYMSGMYCVRYLGLFALLTLGALAPFISLIASVIPLFFPRIAIMIRAFARKED